jgi:hypothetical protein
MPSSEDYTVVWVGISVNLKPTEVPRAVQGTHRLIRLAHEAGLDSWCDSFVTDTAEGYCILIGKHLSTLGYKEGRTKYKLSTKRLHQILAETTCKLRHLKHTRPPKLYVLVHVEDAD